MATTRAIAMRSVLVRNIATAASRPTTVGQRCARWARTVGSERVPLVVMTGACRRSYPQGVLTPWLVRNPSKRVRSDRQRGRIVASVAESRVLVVGYDDAELLDVACVTTTLSMANEFLTDSNSGYDVRLLSPGGRAAGHGAARAAARSAWRAGAVCRVRTEAAAALVVNTDLPLARVADRCGFGSAETLRQAFLDTLGHTPSAHRRAFAGDGRGAQSQHRDRADLTPAPTPGLLVHE